MGFESFFTVLKRTNEFTHNEQNINDEVSDIITNIRDFNIKISKLNKKRNVYILNNRVYMYLDLQDKVLQTIRFEGCFAQYEKNIILIQHAMVTIIKTNNCFCYKFNKSMSNEDLFLDIKKENELRFADFIKDYPFSNFKTLPGGHFYKKYAYMKYFRKKQSTHQLDC